MLNEFEEIERSAGADKAADLRKALHFLLRRQFVFSGDPRTGAVYAAIMDGRFRNAVDGFFETSTLFVSPLKRNATATA